VPGKIIAYDLGTGGNKASLFDEQGSCLAFSFVPYQTHYPDAGWHEQRPEDWWQAVVASTRELLSKTSVAASDVECLAISGQSLGVVPVDGAGKLLREKTPIWSDTRASRQSAAFFQKVDRRRWYLATGNGFPAECYALFKIMWYRDNEPELFSRVATVLGSKDYVNLRLTGRACTDYSYASGSGAYSLLDWGYESEFLKESGLPPEIFPEIVPSTRILGTLAREAAEELGLPRSVKVACGGGQLLHGPWGAQHPGGPCVHLPGLLLLDRRFLHEAGAGLPGQALRVHPRGAGAVHLGGEHLFGRKLLPLDPGQRVRRRLLRGDGRAGRHLPAGSQQAAVQPQPGRRGNAGVLPEHPRLLRRAGPAAHARGPARRYGGHCPEPRGGAGRARRFVPLDSQMLMVGGGSKSPLWRQIFADVYGMDIVKTNIDQEAASLGAAAVAAVGAGLWKDFAPVDAVHRVASVEKPIEANAAVYRKLMPAFEHLRQSQAALGDMLKAIHI
jgi:xylulokinase